MVIIKKFGHFQHGLKRTVTIDDPGGQYKALEVVQVEIKILDYFMVLKVVMDGKHQVVM